jgi:Fe-S cluster biogenesis protein NfuA/nitrite reductase/ring-hydroxylating ferredoxin subunit
MAQQQSRGRHAGRDLRAVGSRIEQLLEDLGGVDRSVQAQAEELVRLLVELYGAGLARVVELAREQQPGGPELLGRLAADPLVESLLVLHDLHPEPVEARVRKALDQVRPYLGSHAGGVELLGVDAEGVVRLRLEGSCHGCPSSTVTVKLAIERAVEEAAPEVTRIDVEGLTAAPPAPRLIPAESLFRDRPGTGPGTAAGATGVAGHPDGQARAGGWVALDGFATLPPGQLREVDVDGVAVLTCNVRGSLYAYRNACPSCGSALGAARLDGERLTCPSCRQPYDVRLAGRGLDHPDLHLDPLPLLPEGGGWKVAVAAGAQA